MVSEHIEKAMRKIMGWWNRELIGDRVCIGFVLPKPESFLFHNRTNFRLLFSLLRLYFSHQFRPRPRINIRNRENARRLYSPIYSYFNELWPHPVQGLVDIEKFVNEGIKLLHSLRYFGEELPRFLHQYGARGTPIIMAAYLGAELEFLENTVLARPVIDSWDTFKFEVKPPNFWYEDSLKLVEIATRKSRGEFLVDLPDLGDVFTNLYLLRGPQIFEEIGFEPKILEIRDKFINFWIEVYQDFWEITSRKFPGSSNWLIWAPGKSYACQCDASCIAVATLKKEIAPIVLKRIVEDFIIPELERLGKYLDYIIWHLDGQEELEFLDILLDLPQIKAIQWRPNFGNPADPQWLPLLKKIQHSKKSLWIAAENEKEVEFLIENLSPESLYISGGFTGKTEREAREFLKWVENLTRQRIRQTHYNLVS